MSAVQAQQLNKYKYVIVPAQYEFTAGKDKYQLNSLTKFLFNKYGYTAFMEGDEFPEDLEENRCLAVTADAKKIKAFLKIKVQLDLLDCNGLVVASSKIGQTKEKNFEKGYGLALRDAFVTFQAMEYEYTPSENVVAIKKPEKETSSNAEEIAKLKAEVEVLKKEKEQAKEEEVKVDTSILLYAQPIENGFQLVDTTPKKVMILLATPKADVFSVKDKNAIVYKENGKWYYSEVTSNGNVTKELNIKF